MADHNINTEFSTGTYQQVNGINIYYEWYPHATSQKTIVFLHGFLASCFCFRHLIRELKEDYSIITIDIPPFGKSGKSLSFEYSYRNIARTLNCLLQELNITRAILVGHSMGGQIGLHMINDQPEKFELAVLLASSGYLQRARPWAIALSYLPGAHLFVKRHFIRTGGVQGNLEQVVHDRALITEEMKNGYLEPFLQNDGIFRALAKMLRDREGDLPSEVLHKIMTPCYLIWGENDRIVPLSVGKRLAHDLPHAELFVFPETGHLLQEERPQEICQIIKKLIR